MYYPIGWHKCLKIETKWNQEECEILSIQANSEKELFLILTSKSIHLWFTRPIVEIVCHRRSVESIENIGSNRSAVWKTDSSVIVVSTSRDQLIFYKVSGLGRRSAEPSSISPALTIFSFGKLDLSSIGVSCLMSAEEELIIGARNGDIYGIKWDGNIDDQFPWSLAKDVPKGSDYTLDLKFSSVLAGFVFVFYSGKVGFLPLKNNTVVISTDQESIPPRLSYLNGVQDATCTDVNHKFRLAAFGLKSSHVIICNIDESNKSLAINQQLQLSQSKFPHEPSKLGPVESMQYSPDGFAILVCWTSGVFAIWSVFGSILFCSIQWQLESQSIQASCPAWGREGYSIWLRRNQELIVIPIARSSLPSNPHSACSSDTVILMGEDRIYLGPSVPQADKFDHWFVIDIPDSYLTKNYPIRYASVDRECKNLAIAGNKGFAIHQVGTNEWKYFTKQSQHDGFTVCSDLIWWGEYLVTTCFNLENALFEIRAYSRSGNLDNEFSVCQITPMEVIRTSIFENRLLVLYSNGSMGMFMLNTRLKPGSSYPLPKNIQPNGLPIHISPIENLVITTLQANAHCISSIALTRLHIENERTDDSILLNTCGKLFLLERDDKPSALTNVTFRAVSVIATNVEQFWISPEISNASELSYFKKSLWIYCGGKSHHLQVWLPLLNDKHNPPSNSYVPDRILLPIKSDIYPLAIRSSSPGAIGPDDAIVLGAESDILYRDNEVLKVIPYSTVKRQCRIYLHRILLELLLNQHLGYYARKVAETCQTLPYFAHCLELLLHEVLEKEATSPVPVPDPMLSQVVKFIKEFPIYPETVISCARKSEPSMWPYLFDERAAGDPKKLLQQCIDENKLDAAAACLIILYSSDKNVVSSDMVEELIGAARKEPKYTHLIDDLQNFLAKIQQ